MFYMLNTEKLLNYRTLGMKLMIKVIQKPNKKYCYKEFFILWIKIP